MLDPDEFGAASAFKNFDADGNGKIDGRENEAGRLRQFRLLDKDSDGKLTSEEFAR